MGSANCKEYSTTTSKRVDNAATKPQDGEYNKIEVFVAWVWLK